VEGRTVSPDRWDVGGEVVCPSLIHNGETQPACWGCLAGEVWHQPPSAPLAFGEVVDIDYLLFFWERPAASESVNGLDCLTANWRSRRIGDDLKLEPPNSCNDATCDVGVALGNGIAIARSSLNAGIACGAIPRGYCSCQGACVCVRG